MARTHTMFKPNWRGASTVLSEHGGEAVCGGAVVLDDLHETLVDRPVVNVEAVLLICLDLHEVCVCVCV